MSNKMEQSYLAHLEKDIKEIESNVHEHKRLSVYHTEQHEYWHNQLVNTTSILFRVRMNEEQESV